MIGSEQARDAQPTAGEAELEELREITRVASTLRDAQRVFFAHHEREALIASKKLEKELDALLLAWETRDEPKQGGLPL